MNNSQILGRIMTASNAIAVFAVAFGLTTLYPEHIWWHADLWIATTALATAAGAGLARRYASLLQELTWPITAGIAVAALWFPSYVSIAVKTDVPLAVGLAGAVSFTAIWACIRVAVITEDTNWLSYPKHVYAAEFFTIGSIGYFFQSGETILFITENGSMLPDTLFFLAFFGVIKILLWHAVSEMLQKSEVGKKEYIQLELDFIMTSLGFLSLTMMRLPESVYIGYGISMITYIAMYLASKSERPHWFELEDPSFGVFAFKRARLMRPFQARFVSFSLLFGGLLGACNGDRSLFDLSGFEIAVALGLAVFVAGTIIFEKPNPKLFDKHS